MRSSEQVAAQLIHAGVAACPRPVSRVLVTDSLERVLLFDTQLAYTRVWMTPGGALNPGESHEAAALRELWEETGLRGVDLSPCLWTIDFSFVYEGRVYDQHERYFAVRVDSLAVARDNWEAAEADEIVEPRWWSTEEIAASMAGFRPRNLASLLPDILAGRYPAEPFAAPVEEAAIVLHKGA